jgi:hypothetical protein
LDLQTSAYDDKNYFTGLSKQWQTTDGLNVCSNESYKEGRRQKDRELESRMQRQREECKKASRRKEKNGDWKSESGSDVKNGQKRVPARARTHTHK